MPLWYGGCFLRRNWYLRQPSDKGIVITLSLLLRRRPVNLSTTKRVPLSMLVAMMGEASDQLMGKFSVV
jgi:hypothetical protein